MTEEESKNLIMKYEKELELSEAQIKRWGGKRYLVLISVVDGDCKIFCVNGN
jgi:hypothetical protein